MELSEPVQSGLQLLADRGCFSPRAFAALLQAAFRSLLGGQAEQAALGKCRSPRPPARSQGKPGAGTQSSAEQPRTLQAAGGAGGNEAASGGSRLLSPQPRSCCSAAAPGVRGGGPAVRPSPAAEPPRPAAASFPRVLPRSLFCSSAPVPPRLSFPGRRNASAPRLLVAYERLQNLALESRARALLRPSVAGGPGPPPPPRRCRAPSSSSLSSPWRLTHGGAPGWLVTGCSVCGQAPCRFLPELGSPRRAARARG